MHYRFQHDVTLSLDIASKKKNNNNNKSMNIDGLGRSVFFLIPTTEDERPVNFFTCV